MVRATREVTSKKGWHSEQIKAAIRMRQLDGRPATLEAFSIKAGFGAAGVSNVIRGKRWQRVERAIASFIGQPVQVLWPERYLPDGRPRPDNLGRTTRLARAS